MTAIARYVADASHGHACRTEWLDLARVVRRAQGRHLNIPHPPPLPKGYTSLGPDYLITTYEHALEELERHVHLSGR